MAETAPKDSFPHEVSCSNCRQENVCNHCGKKNVKPSTGRCTNGRCAECCRKHCTHRSY